jgi:hypothetical protein
MDAPVHLRDIDPTGANAVHLGMARRGNGRDVPEFAESTLQIREVRGRGRPRRLRAFLSSQVPQTNARPESRQHVRRLNP